MIFEYFNELYKRLIIKIMKKEFFKLTLIFLCIAISAFAFSQETIDLKYNFAKGKKYIQNTQITQNIVQTMGAQEIKILSEVKAKNELSVENVENDGTASVLVSASEISVRSSVMGRDTTMHYKDLKDKVRIKVANTGKSISSEKVDSSEVAAVVSQLNLGKLTFLPGKAVKIGDTWKDKPVEHKNPTSGNPFTIDISSDIEYVFTGKETVDGKEYLKISFSGSMAVTGKGTQMGMEMFIEGSGKTEGFTYYDSNKIMVVSSEENTEMNMNIAVSGPQNMTIPMTQSIKNITTFEEKK
jgi:hypothetical protein